MKYLNIALGKNSTRYLQTVLLLIVTKKQETPKLINCNFVASQKDLKDIANRSNSIGTALINILRWFNFFEQKHDNFCSMLQSSESDSNAPEA